MKTIFALISVALSVSVVDASVQKVGVDGCVPFERRVEAHERLVEILTADAEVPPADILECTRAVCKKPFRAKRKGQPSFFEGRVENGALLRAAARYNAVNTITWLLRERKADPHDMLWDDYAHPLSDEVSALHIAAEYGAVEAIEQLLNAGVNPNVVDKHGDTPLMRAAAGGAERAFEAVKLLLARGANAALRNYEGKAAVDMVPPGENRVFGSLCRYGVRPQDKARYAAWVSEERLGFSSDNPFLYMWYAVHADELADVEAWLKKGVNPQGNLVGVPPLLVAINHGNADMVRLLMRYGAAFPQDSEPEYFPWLYAAVLCGNPNIVAMLPYSEPKADEAESPFVVALRGNCGVAMAAALCERGANREARARNSARDFSCFQIVRIFTQDEQLYRLLQSYE